METGLSPAEAELDKRINDVADPSAPSVTKFAGVNSFFEDLLGLPPKSVWTTYVSKPGNLNVRFRQPGPLRQRPELGVAVLAPAADLKASEIPAGRLLRPTGHVGTIAMVTKSPDGWRVASVVQQPASSLASKLATHFPEASAVHPADTPVGSVVGGPGGSITAIPLVVTERIRRMVRRAIASAPAVLLVGPPGTGKSRLVHEMIDEAREDPQSLGLSHPPEARWVTPEESWTTRDLVGGETVDEAGRLRFRPGHVLDALRLGEWLVLDEANRADMDKIFGGLLTWLAGQEVELGPASTDVAAPKVVLGWHDGDDSHVEHVDRLDADDVGSDPIRFLAGREWRLLGTYNAVDAQRVFRFGQALGRRFVRVPVPPMRVEDFAGAITDAAKELSEEARDSIVKLYSAHVAEPATTIGPALFFWIPNYVRVAMSLAAPVTADEPAIEETTAGETPSPIMPAEGADAAPQLSLVAEAYLAAAGAWLARLDSSDLEQLGYRIVTTGALPELEWEWLSSLLPALT